MSDPNTIAQLLSALTQQQPTTASIRPNIHKTSPLNVPTTSFFGETLNGGLNGSLDVTSLNLEHIRPSSSGTLSLANIMSNINQPSNLNVSGMHSSSKLQKMHRISKELGYDDIRSRRDDFYDREWRERGIYSKTQRRRTKCTKERSISPIRKKSKKPKVTETVKIETNFVGLIIGRGGESLKHIEQETGARVQFYPERTSTMNQRMATISGTQSQVDTAKKRIFSVIEENKILKGLASNMKNNIEDINKSAQENGYSSIQIYIPNKAVGMIIGRGGESIRDLQERSKTYINIAHENETIHGMRPAYIFGTSESIQTAKNMIDEIIKTDSVVSFEAENPPDLTLQIPNVIEVTQVPQTFSTYSHVLRSNPRKSDPPDSLKSELETHEELQKSKNDNISFKNSFLKTLPNNNNNNNNSNNNSKRKGDKYVASTKPVYNPIIPSWFLEKNVFLYNSIKSEEPDSKTTQNVSNSDLYDIHVFEDRFFVTKNSIKELIAHLNTSFILDPSKKKENNSSRKTNLMLTCPIKGSVYFLDSIVHEISNLLEADLIKISPQDLEDLVGDIFEEDCTGIFNTGTFRNFSFTTHNKKLSIQENDEAEEQEDIEGEEESISEINLNHNIGKKIVLGPVLQVLTASLSKNSNNRDFHSALQSLKHIGNNVGLHEKLSLILSKLSISNIKKQKKFQSLTLSTKKMSLCSRNKTIIYIQDYSSLTNSISGNYVLKVLWEAVNSRRKKGENIVIVAGSHKENIDYAGSIRDDMFLPIEQFYRNIFIIPIISKDQDSLYISEMFNKYQTMHIKEINIRHLNSLLKRRCGANFELDIPKFLHSDLKLFPNIQSEIWSFDFIHRIISVAIGLYQGSRNNQEVISLNALDISNAIELIKENNEAKKSWEAASKYQQEKWKQQSQEDKKKKSFIDLNNLDCNKYEKRLLSGVVNPEMISVGFDSVRTLPSTKNILQTLISLPLKKPEAFNFGVLSRNRISGVLLFGPPGSGKTLLAKAVAKDCGARVLEVKGSEIFNMYVGEGEKNVKAIFSLARKLSPCVVFIDEVDAIFASRRSDYNNPSHREVINQFMSEWDGLINQNMGVIIMGATNRPFDLDEAIIRRMPKRILVDLPTEEDRKEILKIHLKDETLADDVNFDELSKKTILFSGSDLKNLCVAAALASINENLQNENINEPYSRILRKSHFQNALNEITSSISNDMSSLTELRKWDEKYGKKKDILKKKWGFGDINVSDLSNVHIRKSDDNI
ncbi:hypothetical protein PMAC_002628 [Pneumocystis sp. 'macacae']|nr:hypothetical protein PMAC_002628 [Pneumocystis sp. 'macacae']